MVRFPGRTDQRPTQAYLRYVEEVVGSTTRRKDHRAFRPRHIGVRSRRQTDWRSRPRPLCPSPTARPTPGHAFARSARRFRFTLILRIGLALAIATLPYRAQGQILIERDDQTPGDLLVVHRGGPPVVALRIGGRILTRVAPGEQRRLTGAAPASGKPWPQVAGRIPLAHWPEALGDVSAPWAEFHLRTSGHLLDAVAPGPPGDPQRSAAWRALATADQRALSPIADTVAIDSDHSLRLALLARAARHMPPGPLLQALVRRIEPSAARPAWPPPYRTLEGPAELVRAAIEAQAIPVLPILATAPRWAADRGLTPPAMLRLLSESCQAVSAVIGDHESSADPAWPRLTGDAEARLEILEQAVESGDFERALSIVVANLTGAGCSGPSQPHLSAPGCYALDVGAQRRLRAGQRLAAEVLLRVGLERCVNGADQAQPTLDARIDSLRRRTGELHRARGDILRGRGDLVGALDAYRHAQAVAQDAWGRVRIADTLAELAILHYADANIALADAFVAEARAVDDTRPRVRAAAASRPEVDSRIRLALLVMIGFALIFALRRLGRVFRDPRYEIRRGL